MSDYDYWKTTDPQDEFLGPAPAPAQAPAPRPSTDAPAETDIPF